MDILLLRQSMSSAMEFADDFLKRLKIAMDTVETSGKILVAKSREIKETGGVVTEDLNQKLRDLMTIREYQYAYLDAVVNVKTRVAQVLSVAMNPPKDNFLNRGKMADLQKGAALVEQMIQILKIEMPKVLGNDFLTLTHPEMHQEALKLMANRFAKPKSN